jgi:hypothetical protein
VSRPVSPSESPPGGVRLPELHVGLLALLAGAKLAAHLATSCLRYGYFRDELYFLDMARHLSFGYVDAAPLVAVYAKLALLMGGSLFALRIIPAVMGAALVALTVVLARELGGGRFAQGLAGLCVLVAPGLLAMDDILSMNAAEPLLWMAAILVVVRILRTGNSRLWLWFGLFVGLGLENKHSTLFFGAAVAAGILLTRHRRELARPWIWAGLGAALLLFLPNVLWQIRHGFPTLEDLENVRRTGKNVLLSPGAFLGQQVLSIGPILLPVWLAGVVSFFRNPRWRLLGWTFVVFFAEMFAMHGKVYYVFPIYPMALAGGAVAFEAWLARRRSRGKLWPKAAIAGAIVVVSAPIFPIVLPILSPPQYVGYTRRLHVSPKKTEVYMQSLWPQLFADQIGWESMAREVAGIYDSLPPQERARTGIVAGNYGEAGAINLFGPKYGLPRAMSGHQSHWFWDRPTRHYDNLIVLEWSAEDARDNCASVEAFHHFELYGMGEENTPIQLCRGATFDLAKVWPKLKHWN